MNYTRAVLWVGQYSWRGTANARYYELVRRFQHMCKIKYPSLRGIHLLERVLIPHLLPLLGQRYYVLWDPGARFTKWWPNVTIVDIDDPTFTSEEVEALIDPRITTIVTTTPELAEKLSREIGKISASIAFSCRRPLVKVIPSGFSQRDIVPTLVDRIRRKLKTKPVVGYMSPYLTLSHRHQNDVSLLLEAMSKVWKREPSIELWLIGSPDPSIKSIAKYEARIRLIGSIPRRLLLNYVCNFDVATYPRELDHGGRFSVKLIEYMGCGVPIVATMVSETKIVEEAGAGFRVGSTDEFAEAILLCIRMVELRQKLINNALEYARNYDWDYLAVRYEREVFGFPI